jgi:glycopeptide antibiotics resistance protein
MRQYLLPLYVFSVLLLVLLPVNDADSFINHSYVINLRADYVFHLLMFLPWMFFLMVKNYTGNFSWMALGVIFAAAAEFLQYFVPYRAFNINDLIANIAGILAGGLLYVAKGRKIILR